MTKFNTYLKDLSLLNSNFVIFTKETNLYLKKLIKYLSYKFNNKIDSIFLREYYKNYRPNFDKNHFFSQYQTLYSYELIFKNKIEYFGVNNLAMQFQIDCFTNYGNYIYCFVNTFRLYKEYLSITHPFDNYREICNAETKLKFPPNTLICDYDELFKEFYKSNRKNIYNTLNNFF